MFKSQLQEYAQKAGLPAPVYDIKKEGPSHEPQFKASVTLRGQVYESPTFFRNLKKAEHAAAEVALTALGATTSGPLHESGLCKNLLQEYAQKCKLPLPVYSTTKSGETHMPTFIATVEIAGVHYNGGHSKTKKEAEISAARTALVAIYADSGAPLEAVKGHAATAEPSTGGKRKKKFGGGGFGKKQKVMDEPDMMDEGGNGDVLQVVADTETASDDTKQENGSSMKSEAGNGDALQAVADAEKIQAVADTEKLQAVADTEKLQAVADTEQLQAVADTEQLQAVADTEKLQAVADTEKLQAVADTEKLQAVADTETANERVDDSKQANGCSSLPTDSADKGPEQNLLDSAAAENPNISPCGNGTELSVQSPHAQEQ